MLVGLVTIHLIDSATPLPFAESSVSRSESQITVGSKEVNQETESEVEGITVSTINFVDLAGSERSSNSGIQDSEERLRMKEVVQRCCL